MPAASTNRTTDHRSVVRFVHSVSKNYSNALVFCIIREAGVYVWNSGEKMRGKSL